MPNKRKLSDTQIIAIKAAYDKYKLSGNSAQKAMEAVAQEWGVHWQTIRKVLLTKNQNLDQKLLKDIKGQQASKIDNIVNSILADLDNSDKILKGLSPAQAALALCQLIDKSMKLKGEDVTKVEIFEVGEKVQKRLEELKAMKMALQKSLIIPEKPEDN